MKQNKLKHYFNYFLLTLLALVMGLLIMDIISPDVEPMPVSSTRIIPTVRETHFITPVVNVIYLLAMIASIITVISGILYILSFLIRKISSHHKKEKIKEGLMEKITRITLITSIAIIFTSVFISMYPLNIFIQYGFIIAFFSGAIFFNSREKKPMSHQKKATMIAGGALIVIILALWGCFSVIDDNNKSMEAECTLNGFGTGICKFTNKNSFFSAKKCVRVNVINKITSESKTTSSICSGSVEAYETKNIDYRFIFDDLCTGALGTRWMDVCSFEVLESF